MTVKTKVIKGFPDYEISSDGRVFSNRTVNRKELSPSTSTGYAKVALQGKNGKKDMQIHRLVGMHFLDVPKNYKSMVVNHKDGNKLNNKLSNLEWTDRKGNGEHYGKKLHPKYKAERKEKKEADLKARLSIVQHAHTACTANPELFHAVYKTVMCDGVV